MKCIHCGIVFVLTFFVVTLPFLSQQLEQVSWYSTTTTATITTSSSTGTPTLTTSLLHTNNHKTASSSNNWQRVKQALCPAMIPNTAKGDTIFALAAAELDMTSAITTASSSSPLPPRRRPALVFDFLPELNVWHDTRTNYTVAYVAVYKGANNQINAFTNWVYEHELRQQTQSQNQQNWRHERWAFQGPQRDPLDWLKTRLGKDASQGGNTCLITAVRDPASRFLSAYNEIEYRFDQNYYHGLQQTNINNQTTTMNRRNRHAWGFTNVPLGTPARVETFVRNLVKWYFYCPSLQHKAFCRAEKLELMHLWGMAGMLATLHQHGNHPLTQYLPGISNLNERWPRFVADTCFDDTATTTDTWRPPLPFPPNTTMPLMGQHGSSQDPEGTYAAAKQMWNAQGATARAICALQVMDYACFEFENGIPDICQDVFAQPAFVQAILSSP